jgi:ATP-dependent DNA helicase RecQ
MIQRWKPKPFPTWVTCVPSLNRPTLVPDFARRLAAKLGLPFIYCISKTHSRHPQKQMSNSYQQAHNLDGAFVIDSVID